MEMEINSTPTVSTEIEACGVDVLRDIAWVYRHAGELFVENDRGDIKLNPRMNKEVPAASTKAMIRYAFNDWKSFMEKFVSRLLPKNVEPEREQTQEELVNSLDPSFHGLQNYFHEEIDSTN